MYRKETEVYKITTQYLRQFNLMNYFDINFDSFANYKLNLINEYFYIININQSTKIIIREQVHTNDRTFKNGHKQINAFSIQFPPQYKLSKVKSDISKRISLINNQFYLQPLNNCFNKYNRTIYTFALRNQSDAIKQQFIKEQIGLIRNRRNQHQNWKLGYRTVKERITARLFYNNSQMETVDRSFSRGELVWAKLTGHPWWPGAVVEVDEKQGDLSASTCIVKFLGEDSHSVLPLTKLAKYSDSSLEYSKKANSNKKLRESIKIADNILNGKLNVERELNKVKVSLFSQKFQKQQLKTAMMIEDRITKEHAEIQSTEISCCPSLYYQHEKVRVVEESDENKIGLDIDDEEVMKELAEHGIGQQNVTDVLEYGIIKRLVVVDHRKAKQMKLKARKMLLRKYFPKLSLKNIPEQTTSPQIKESAGKSTKQPVRKTKKIQKNLKQVKREIPLGQIEFLCVKRLYSILKTYELQISSCRRISACFVQKLKAIHELQTPEFQRSYINFVCMIKQRRQSTADIQACYDKYFQGQTPQELYHNGPYGLI